MGKEEGNQIIFHKMKENVLLNIFQWSLVEGNEIKTKKKIGDEKKGVKRLCSFCCWCR